MKTENQKAVEKQATKLLKSKGYTWSGQPRGSKDYGQTLFERHMVRIPTCGQPSYRKYS